MVEGDSTPFQTASTLDHTDTSTSLFKSVPSSSSPARPPKSPLRFTHIVSTSLISTEGLAHVRDLLLKFRLSARTMSVGDHHNIDKEEKRTEPACQSLDSDQQDMPIRRKTSSMPASSRLNPPVASTTEGPRGVDSLDALDLVAIKREAPARPIIKPIIDTSTVSPLHRLSQPITSDAQRAPFQIPQFHITQPSMSSSASVGPRSYLSRVNVDHRDSLILVSQPISTNKGKERAGSNTSDHELSQNQSKKPLSHTPSGQTLRKIASKASDIFGSSRRYRLPPPPTPTMWSPTRYAPSSSRQPSPSPGYHPCPANERLIEIPRFKKRELNLAIAAKPGPWRLVWITLWVMWVCFGLSSLFFDVNIMYMIVQCILFPTIGSSTSSWSFAAAAYAICWAISVLVIWLGWEIGFEFWRRWRTARPAIEPIYLSFPASLHLSLLSYHHFTFLAHIRLSPLGTRYTWDIVPELCHALVQLGPGLLPLLPRAAIAIVLLTALSKPRPELQTPFGAVDRVPLRDQHFFRSDSPGQLSTYSLGVLYAFVAITALKLAIVLMSIIVLFTWSGKFSNDRRLSKRSSSKQTPSRDPSQTESPQKSWVSAENEFQWAWRDRTRARIQDAFELCIIRPDRVLLLMTPTTPWGARSSMTPPIPLANRTKDDSGVMSAGEFLSSFAVDRSAADPAQSDERPRPESDLLPRHRSAQLHHQASTVRKVQSDGMTLPPSRSSQDVFYTPRDTPSASDQALPQAISEFGVKRLSAASDSSSDDTTALIRTDSTGSDKKSGPISSSVSSSRSSSTRRRTITAASPMGRTIARARSTSVSLLRESLSNGLVKRVRSGTLLSTESKYSQVDDTEAESKVENLILHNRPEHE